MIKIIFCLRFSCPEGFLHIFLFMEKLKLNFQKGLKLDNKTFMLSNCYTLHALISFTRQLCNTCTYIQRLK